MRKPRARFALSAPPEWASAISALRRRLHLTQTAFGHRLRASAMAVSRWERGAQEPPAGSYIELGNLSGDPACWYFWGRAGLRKEDLLKVLPRIRKGLPHTNIVGLEFAAAGSGARKLDVPELVAIPLLKVVAASHGEKGDSAAILRDAPAEGMIAAPKEWC